MNDTRWRAKLKDTLGSFLEKEEKNVLFAYVYGSFGRGDQFFNDIDVAVFLKRVPSQVTDCELKLAKKLERVADRPVDVRLINTMEGFEKLPFNLKVFGHSIPHQKPVRAKPVRANPLEGFTLKGLETCGFDLKVFPKASQGFLDSHTRGGYSKPSMPLLLKSRILKEGVLLFSRDAKATLNFETFLLGEYLDFSHLMREFDKRRLERYGIAVG